MAGRRDAYGAEGALTSQWRANAAWAALLLALVALIVWGGLSPHDPLRPYIASDTMRHVLGFGCLGVAAGLHPHGGLRLAGVICVALLGVGLEVLQQFFGREMSSKDLFFSTVGTFAGFGISASLSLAVTGAKRSFYRVAIASPES